MGGSLRTGIIHYGLCQGLIMLPSWKTMSVRWDHIQLLEPYDKWAIQWGYKIIPDTKSADEATNLNRNRWII